MFSDERERERGGERERGDMVSEYMVLVEKENGSDF